MSDVCVNPTEIREGDLMAYVEGTADKSIVRHIRRCPACARQVEELAALQATLTARLYRHSCPTSEQLIAYREDELRGSEKLVVAQHLRQCPHCARELAALARVERKNLGEWLRGMVKTLDAAPVTPQLQPAGVRGDIEAASLAPQVYRAGEIEIIVSPQPAHAPHRWDLSGLVHVAGRVPEGIGGARVELYRGEGLIAIATVSPRGHFAFPDVEPAGYDLSLVWGEREVRLKGVRVE